VIPLIQFGRPLYSYYPLNANLIMMAKAMETYWQVIICGQTRYIHVNLMFFYMFKYLATVLKSNNKNTENFGK
jgi:hypothetical protein